MTEGNSNTVSFHALQGEVFHLFLDSVAWPWWVEGGPFELRIIQGEKPKVEIISPEVEFPLIHGSRATIEASALSSGRIQRVDFYNYYDQLSPLLSDTRAPYTFTFSVNSAAPPAFFAVAVDTNGLSSTSEIIFFTVQPE